MAQILDQFGQPIRTADLAEPQTARIGQLINRYLESSLDGLTPARLSAALKAADNGDLLVQHRIFADMEERDTHIAAEMGKRKHALLGLDWDIVAPRNATPAEEAAAEWVKEVLQDAIDPLEDLITFLMEAVGHGFACAELEWKKGGGEWLPTYHPRPQEWFRLDTATRTNLRLVDNSAEGAPLQSFGWVWHVPGKPKTGYMGRMGLYRALVWPFIYKAYAIGDFAEFLETFGLPIIIGKYFNGASKDEKASLFQAVTALGHDARAIMPLEMQIEVQKVTGSGGSGSPHLLMVEWADKAQSKLILGGTLTSQADGKTSTNALGNVHNEVRHDILKSDARQIAATLTRDLVYPLIALNKGGIDSLRRCPRLVFDVSESEDIVALAEALPKLSPLFKIPVAWVRDKLHIPAPEGDEEVLGTPVPAKSDAITPGVKTPAESDTGASANATKKPIAALSALPANVDLPDPLAGNLQKLSDDATSANQQMITTIQAMVDAAPSLDALQSRLLQAYSHLDTEALSRIMAAGFALAELQGMSDALDGQ